MHLANLTCPQKLHHVWPPPKRSWMLFRSFWRVKIYKTCRNDPKQIMMKRPIDSSIFGDFYKILYNPKGRPRPESEQKLSQRRDKASVAPRQSKSRRPGKALPDSFLLCMCFHLVVVESHEKAWVGTTSGQLRSDAGVGIGMLRGIFLLSAI